MTDPLTEHPTVQKLQAFVLGTLSLDEVTAIEEHLRGCLECRNSLEQIDVTKDPALPQLAHTDGVAQHPLPDPSNTVKTLILSVPSAAGGPAPADARSHSEIDIECLRFRVDLMSGVGPGIEERLLTFADEARPELLRRLLVVEMEERLRAKLPVPVDDYLRRFPDTRIIEQAYEQTLNRIARESAAEQHLTQVFPKPFDAVGRFREYLFQSQVGEGGMGAVYKALHLRLERTVAFKVLSPDKVQSPEMITRFHREMKSVGKLEHPNIVRAYDAGDYQGCHFLVMEFVDGIPLDALVKRLGQLPVREACEVIRQAAVGLDYAHRHGLVHRDVKPSNLMIAGVGVNRAAVASPPSTASRPSLPRSVTSSSLKVAMPAKNESGLPASDRPALPDTDSMIHNAMESMIAEADNQSAEAKTVSLSRASWELRDQTQPLEDSAEPPAALSVREMAPTVKVLDLGLARLQSESQDLTHESQVVGTLDYIAPEQARRGGNVDHRADIYSLGCTLFTLLAGRAPYGDASHASIAQKVMAHVEEPLPPLEQMRPDVPPRVLDILRRMTAKQPSQRFQSAAAVAETLAPLAQGANLRLLNESDETTVATQIVKGVSRAPWASSTTIQLAGSVGRRRGLVIGLSALLIVLAVGVWWNRLPHSPRTAQDSANFTVGNTSTVSDPPRADEPNVRAVKNRKDLEAVVVVEPDDFALQFEPATSVIAETLKLDPTGPHTQEAWVTPTLPEVKRATHVFGQLQASSVFLDDRSRGWAFGLSLEDGFRHITSKPVERHRRVHVAIVRDNSEMRLFVNGELVSRRDESGQPLMSPPKQFLIGNLFAGLLDELHVSSVARYEQDFTPLARSEPDAHTLALFHCDEGSGDVLKDSSGHERHGRINGPAIWRRVGEGVAVADVPLTPSALLASPDYEWTPLEDLGEPINSPGYEAGASISADGLSLLMHANETRPAPGGKLRIWQAWRHTINDPFHKPVPLEEVVNDQPDSLSDPTITADGLTLAFCMKRDDGRGAFDLWISDRPSGDASWSAPVNAGPGVNSDRDEWEPEISADGLTLLFHSSRTNENGGTDLWMSRRGSRDKPFGPAENLGPELNTVGSEGGATLSSDGLTLLYHRISADGNAPLTHWQSTRQSANHPFGTPQPLVVPGLVENHGVSLNLSAAGDRLYCSTSVRDKSPDIAVSRRVLKRNAPPRK